jgi:hypothetical protein
MNLRHYIEWNGIALKKIVEVKGGESAGCPIEINTIHGLYSTESSVRTLLKIIYLYVSNPFPSHLEAVVVIVVIEEVVEVLLAEEKRNTTLRVHSRRGWF